MRHAALFVGLSLYACGGQAPPANSPNPEPCPEGYQQFGEGCVSQRTFDFMSCTEKRGIKRDILEKSIKQTGGGGSVGVLKVVVVNAAANSVEETLRQDKSEPSENECLILRTCAELSGASVPGCAAGGSGEPSALPRTTEALASALASSDDQALRAYANMQFSSAMMEEALGRPGAQGEATVAQSYFESTRASGDISWLEAALQRSHDPLDPNMRVPYKPVGVEALINVAARAANTAAVVALMNAGAFPHGYQSMNNWALSDPRFLIPLGPILENNQLSVDEKQTLATEFVSHGGIVPRVLPPHSNTYGPIAVEVRNLQKKAGFLLGTELKTTPDLCERKAATGLRKVCKAAQDRYGVDWCKAIESGPRLIGKLIPKERDLDAVVPPFVLRYFLGGDDKAGYFLVEELSYFSGYALLKTDAQFRQLELWRFTKHRPYGMGGCIDDVRRSGFCWTRLPLIKHASTGDYMTEYGAPLRPSRRCADATAQVALRAELLSPKPVKHSDPAVVKCVKEMTKTTPISLIDEASRFDILQRRVLGPRECVLARIRAELLSNQREGLHRPEYVAQQAMSCCLKVLSGQRAP